jgi:hypothetical protein
MLPASGPKNPATVTIVRMNLRRVELRAQYGGFEGAVLFTSVLTFSIAELPFRSRSGGMIAPDWIFEDILMLRHKFVRLGTAFSSLFNFQKAARLVEGHWNLRL